MHVTMLKASQLSAFHETCKRGVRMIDLHDASCSIASPEASSCLLGFATAPGRSPRLGEGEVRDMVKAMVLFYCVRICTVKYNSSPG